MHILFSSHAETRVIERGIDKNDIIKAVINPREVIELKRKRWVGRLIINSRILEVIYTIEGEEIIIITAYYL